MQQPLPRFSAEQQQQQQQSVKGSVGYTQGFCKQQQQQQQRFILISQSLRRVEPMDARSFRASAACFPSLNFEVHATQIERDICCRFTASQC
jgi:hypothetical protein